jgi:pyruvate dehydrogenase E2 component (dihydrolipoamide acetyltransferase)
MTGNFVMPMLGADMEAGILAHWYRAAGDDVHRGDIIAAVETDKGVIDVECFSEGRIGELLVAEGTRVPVGTPLATILGAADTPAPITPATRPAPAPPASPPAMPPRPHASPLARRVANDRGVDLAATVGSGTHGRTLARDVTATLTTPPGAPPPAPTVRSTPRARELAAQLTVDLGALAGTGPAGRVMRRDVEAAAAAHEAPPSDPGARMRRAIAAAMSRANREIPHYYVATTIDLTHTRQWLDAENTRRRVPERLLMAALLTKAVALAVRDHRELNTTWQAGEATPSDAIHLGSAIWLRGGGLVAPAIHNTDQLSLDDLMAALRDLVLRARGGGLRSSELADPTITLTSLGDGGVEELYGVVFPPQVAIVGLGRPLPRPWVVDGQVVPRLLVRATLAGDHRVTDGRVGSAFLVTLDRILQEPAAL